MKIALLSCFYPFRGGIAQFNAATLEELGKKHLVKAFNFTRQYPSFLFPGKSQTVAPEDEAVPVESTALLDTANPFSWGHTWKAIRDWQPDVVLISWWMSWFGPSLGYVARHLKPTCKVVSILHNVIPHEPRFFDRPLTKYFLDGCHGHVALCPEVAADLRRISPDAPMTTLFHPVYAHFGQRIGREAAEEILGIPHGRRNLLFFGLIRPYKGLDILLEAFRKLDDTYQLIIAGEPYGSFAPYQAIIDSLPGKDRIYLFPSYIRDSAVKNYFSAADLAVLPYRSATQSGISAIASHFGVPMVVTDVGGLKDDIGAFGTGLVAPRCEPDAIHREIERYFADPSLQAGIAAAMGNRRARRSWQQFGEELTNFIEHLD